MKKILSGVICAVMLISLSAHGGTVPKGPGSDKKGGKDDASSRERVIIGVVALSNDSKTYTIKEKSGATHFVPASDAIKFHFADMECLDVKADCVMKLGDIYTIRTVRVVDETAWKNRQLELKEAAEKAAAEKKAAAQAKKPKT